MIRLGASAKTTGDGRKGKRERTVGWGKGIHKKWGWGKESGSPIMVFDHPVLFLHSFLFVDFRMRPQEKCSSTVALTLWGRNCRNPGGEDNEKGENGMGLRLLLKRRRIRYKASRFLFLSPFQSEGRSYCWSSSSSMSPNCHIWRWCLRASSCFSRAFFVPSASTLAHRRSVKANPLSKSL